MHRVSSEGRAVELHLLSFQKRKISAICVQLDLSGQFVDREVQVSGGAGTSVREFEAAADVAGHVE